MTVLPEFNQGGTKALLTCFLTPLICTMCLFIIFRTYFSYGLKWKDDPSPHYWRFGWWWKTKQNIWTKNKCLPVISQPSLLLLSWDVQKWGLMKEGEKVKIKKALMSMCLVIWKDHWEVAGIFFVPNIRQCPPRSEKPIIFPPHPIHFLP